MQAGTQDEMAVQQRAGLAEKSQQIFAHLGSARRWRAVFGGPPKTFRERTCHPEGEREGVGPPAVQKPFDEPSNGARQRRALPRTASCARRGMVIFFFVAGSSCVAALNLSGGQRPPIKVKITRKCHKPFAQSPRRRQSHQFPHWRLWVAQRLGQWNAQEDLV